jgi:hypothetical protein
LEKWKGWKNGHKDGTSVNLEALRIVGLRNEGKPGTPIFCPCELGYACPICGEAGDALEFSEYNSFLWCENCNLDIPSCLCIKTKNKKDRITRATDIFLRSVKDALNRESVKGKEKVI